MQFNITEEEINNLIKELEIDLEEASKDGKVWGYKDEFEHISNRYVKISPKLGSILYGDKVITAFHVTSIEDIERIKSLKSTKKQGLSAFTYMGKDRLKRMGGIETSGGVIFELIGKPLVIATRDIMSVTDQRLTRWVPNSYVIPTELHNEFNETISSFKNNNQYPYTGENPTDNQRIYKLRYVALYNRSIDLFIEKHKEQIKKFLQTDMGSSYDEILIHNFEVNDVLLTVDKAKSGGKYSFLVEFNELRRITDYRELNTDELIRFKNYRKRFNEIILELESFIEGKITYTEDPNVSLTWVKERGGMFDREEYRNKLKELTENKTNKKMSKKIKISESQLKTIMERKHTYAGDTNEEEKFDIDQLEDKDKEKIDVKEPEDVNEGFGRDISVQMAIWSHLSDIEYLDSKERQIRLNFIKLIVAKYIPSNIEINEDKLDKLFDEVSNRDFSGNALNDLEPEGPTKDMPGFEGTMDGLDSLSIREDDDEMMNESIKKIKNNFKRFL